MVPHLQALEHHPIKIHYDGQPSRNVYRTDGFYRTADKIFYTRTCRFPHRGLSGYLAGLELTAGDITVAPDCSS